MNRIQREKMLADTAKAIIEKAEESERRDESGDAALTSEMDKVRAEFDAAGFEELARLRRVYDNSRDAADENWHASLVAGSKRWTDVRRGARVDGASADAVCTAAMETARAEELARVIEEYRSSVEQYQKRLLFLLSQTRTGALRKFHEDSLAGIAATSLLAYHFAALVEAHASHRLKLADKADRLFWANVEGSSPEDLERMKAESRELGRRESEARIALDAVFSGGESEKIILSVAQRRLEDRAERDDG